MGQAPVSTLRPSRAGRPARVVDVVLIAVSLIVCYLTAVGTAAYPAVPGWYWPVDIGLGLLASGALWWVRRYPVAVGALLIVPGTLSIAAGVPVLAGVYRLGALARPRVSLALVVLHIAIALPYHWVAPVPGMTTLVWLVVIPLLYLLALSLGLLSRSRRQVIEGLEQAALADRERYDAQLATLRRDERERIAREMHDVLAHRISLLSVHSGALQFRTAPASAPGHVPASREEVHEAAVVISENARLAVEELRELLLVLRDDELSEPTLDATRPQPRLQDVHGLVDEARRAGQQVELTIDEEAVAGTRASLQRTAYRIVQEGLTNARKHAPRSPVAVVVRAAGGRLHVEVTNPVALGLTAAEFAGSGAGLAGLTERARIDGGVLRHGVDGGRFALAGDLPIEAA